MGSNLYKDRYTWVRIYTILALRGFESIRKKTFEGSKVTIPSNVESCRFSSAAFFFYGYSIDLQLIIVPIFLGTERIQMILSLPDNKE